MSIETSQAHNPEYEPHMGFGLRHQERFKVDLASLPLYSEEETYLKHQISGPTVAELYLAIDKIEIVDVRRLTDDDTAFLIIAEHYIPNNPNQKLGKVALKNGGYVDLGRDFHRDRIAYSNLVSRDHATVMYSEFDGLLIQNHQPSNPTIVVAAGEIEPHVQFTSEHIDLFEDDRTAAIYSRLPEETINNYIIITRNTSEFNRKYSFGSSQREVIYVDGDSAPVQNFLAELYRDLPRDNSPQNIFKTLISLINEKIKYNKSKVEEMIANYSSDRFVPLSRFLEQGAGVCRHQNLLAAFCIEQLIKKRFLPDGSAHLERNMFKLEKSVHAWALYRRAGYEDTVIDATHQYIGGRYDSPNWIYHVEAEE